MHFRPRKDSLKAILLDLDGLLVTTERIGLETLLSTAKVFENDTITEGILIEIYMTGLGLSSKEGSDWLASQLADYYELSIFLPAWQEAFEAMMDSEELTLMPGVAELLGLVEKHGLETRVVTSTDRQRAAKRLIHVNRPELVDRLVCPEGKRQPKPDPELYLYALSGLGIDTRHCIALEDTPVGSQAALAAGLYTVQVLDPTMTPRTCNRYKTAKISSDSPIGQDNFLAVESMFEVVSLLEDSWVLPDRIYHCNGKKFRCLN